MKLKSLININEKKESIATSPSTNITLHYDKGFKNVGENGTPELSFTISMSSTGGKEFFRGVGDSEEAEKISEAIKLELRRALRKFDKRVQMIVDEYKLQTRQ
jgi:hypothetical protein